MPKNRRPSGIGHPVLQLDPLLHGFRLNWAAPVRLSAPSTTRAQQVAPNHRCVAAPGSIHLSLTRYSAVTSRTRAPAPYGNYLPPTTPPVATGLHVGSSGLRHDAENGVSDIIRIATTNTRRILPVVIRNTSFRPKASSVFAHLNPRVREDYCSQSLEPVCRSPAFFTVGPGGLI